VSGASCPHGERLKRDCRECRRAYDRGWARRRREAARVEANRSRTTCAVRTCGGQLREHVDSLGRLVVSCPTCERREAGICRDCPRPVDGAVGKATRCAECRVAARRRQAAAYEKHRDRRHARVRERKYWRKPENRTRRRAQQKAWRDANPDKVKQYKRRTALNPTERRRERERWWNSQPERIAKKREQARRRYYELHPERPKPVCAKCDRRIPWEPKPGGHAGRPPKYHMECSPWKRQRKDYQRQVAQERAA
jgi:hypothetical protein